MIISDGTTDLTFLEAGGNPDPELIDSERVTAGGIIKVQPVGERYVEEVSIRLNGAQYRQLLDLLQNGASNYYYTPTVVPPEYDNDYFLLKVRIDRPNKKIKAYSSTSGEIVYHLSLRIRSSEIL